MQSKRVLFLRSNSVDPDPRVQKSAEALGLAGYQVLVLAWDRGRSSLPMEKNTLYEIRRIPFRARYGSGILNLPRLVIWQLILIFWLIKNRKAYDFIHACDFDTVIPAYLAKVVFRKALVYDIFDFFSDHIRGVPKTIRTIIKAIDNYMIAKVDGVILADESRIEQISTRKQRNIVVINNTPKDIDNLIRSREKNTQRFYISYVGLLQLERGLFELLDILESQPDWELDLAGFGGDEGGIINKANNLSNVNFYGRVSYEVSLELSKRADVLYAVYDPTVLNHRFASPNKLYEALMLGKPVIVARDTNIDKIVKKYDCGVVVNYDRESIFNGLFYLYRNPNQRARMGKAARSLYEQSYRWDLMEKRLLNFYRNCGLKAAGFGT